MPNSVFQAGGLVNFRLTEISGNRERGRFTSAGLTAQRDRNRQMALTIQRKTAELIESRIIWRAESTGRLVKNTLASDNVEYDTWGLGVGNFDFLNRSTSKYWRTVEQGSAAVWRHPFVGTHLWARYKKGSVSGFWTDTEGTSSIVVHHEIRGQDAYGSAATESALKDFAIKNVAHTVWQILS